MAEPAPAKHAPRWRMVRPGGHGPYIRVCIDCPKQGERGEKPRHESWPDVLDRSTLRGATDHELQAHFTHRDNARTHRQILAEMKRRDNADAAKKRATSRKFERYEHVEREIAAAEHATNGYMVNKAGQARGVTEWQLMTGRERDADKYSTDELKAYWERHPRPTARNLSADPTRRQRQARVADRFLARAH
jgi:hypothetical protein